MTPLSVVWPLARPILRALDPERAHDLTLTALTALPLKPPKPDDARLAVDAFGLHFPNPIGLAAGFDKNGVFAHKAGAIGLGFVEVGTLTPLAQSGNPKPRLFRLPADGAVINRFGFNNLGQDHARAALRKGTAVLGINIGANKASPDRIADYVIGIRALAANADYFTINVSSPNTPNLRDLQQPDALRELLARVLDARNKAAPASGRKPVLLKIAPDLTLGELDAIVTVACERGVDGMVVSNTTISRPAGLELRRHGRQTGGLSGRPLFALSTRMLAETYKRVEQRFPLIGVGGIDSAETAIAKIEAGATVLQLYSALVYRGPALIAQIKEAILARLGTTGRLAALVGSDTSRWTDPAIRVD